MLQIGLNMTNIEWTVENEIQLFYAMMNHKPIGINKHFQMMAIHDNLTSSLNCELYTDVIWKKLETLYDLQALDESDQLPFPNVEEDFHLPQDSFSNLIEGKLSTNSEEGIDDSKSKMRLNSKKEEEGTSYSIMKRDKMKDIDDDEERDIPKRSMKRGRDSLGKSSSSPAPYKRRR